VQSNSQNHYTQQEMASGHGNLGLFLGWQLKMKFLYAIYQPSAPPIPPRFLLALPFVTRWCKSVVDGWYPKPGPLPAVGREWQADHDCCAESGLNFKMCNKSNFSS